MLSRFILNPTEILSKMDIQQPVPRFYVLSHPGFRRKQLLVGNIIMPFTCFSALFLNLCIEYANTVQP